MGHTPNESFFKSAATTIANYIKKWGGKGPQGESASMGTESTPIASAMPFAEKSAPSNEQKASSPTLRKKRHWAIDGSNDPLAPIEVTKEDGTKKTTQELMDEVETEIEQVELTKKRHGAIDDPNGSAASIEITKEDGTKKTTQELMNEVETEIEQARNERLASSESIAQTSVESFAARNNTVADPEVLSKRRADSPINSPDEDSPGVIAVAIKVKLSAETLSILVRANPSQLMGNAQTPQLRHGVDAHNLVTQQGVHPLNKTSTLNQTTSSRKGSKLSH